MAKVGGTLVANTNSQPLAADMLRNFLQVTNVSSTDTIYLEFGGQADTVVAGGSVPLLPQTVLTLNGGEIPDIKKTVNLKSTGTPQYHVWDATL